MPRDLLTGRPPRRCVGRAALVRALRALRVRVTRFALHRAATAADRAWAARVLDHLVLLDQIAAGPTFTPRPSGDEGPTPGVHP